MVDVRLENLDLTATAQREQDSVFGWTGLVDDTRQAIHCMHQDKFYNSHARGARCGP